jgi:hypothetical protein
MDEKQEAAAKIEQRPFPMRQSMRVISTILTNSRLEIQI